MSAFHTNTIIDKWVNIGAVFWATVNNNNNNKKWCPQRLNSPNNASKAFFGLRYVFFLSNLFKCTNNYSTSTSTTRWPMTWQLPLIAHKRRMTMTMNDNDDDAERHPQCLNSPNNPFEVLFGLWYFLSYQIYLNGLIFPLPLVCYVGQGFFPPSINHHPFLTPSFNIYYI